MGHPQRLREEYDLEIGNPAGLQLDFGQRIPAQIPSHALTARGQFALGDALV